MDLHLNGGIIGNCQFCLAKGYVYHNASLGGTTLIMCDDCRDDAERRKMFVESRSIEHGGFGGKLTV